MTTKTGGRPVTRWNTLVTQTTCGVGLVLAPNSILPNRWWDSWVTSCFFVVVICAWVERDWQRSFSGRRRFFHNSGTHRRFCWWFSPCRRCSWWLSFLNRSLTVSLGILIRLGICRYQCTNDNSFYDRCGTVVCGIIDIHRFIVCHFSFFYNWFGRRRWRWWIRLNRLAFIDVRCPLRRFLRHVTNDV